MSDPVESERDFRNRLIRDKAELIGERDRLREALSDERDLLIDFAAYLMIGKPWGATADAFLASYRPAEKGKTT